MGKPLITDLSESLKEQINEGGSMTKAEIEAVFTGEISSHSHPAEALPKATESTLGGIVAAEKTTETAEVKIDTATGKLYVPAAGEAANGVAAGGTAGQVYAKIDATDYNAEWIDVPISGIGAEVNLIPLFNPIWTPSVSSAIINGNIATSDYWNLGSGTRTMVADLGQSIRINKVMTWMYYGDGRTYRKCGLYGSNDNVNWDTLLEPVDTIYTVAGVTVNINNSYRYIKWYCEANATYNSNDYVEVKIFGNILMSS